MFILFVAGRDVWLHTVESYAKQLKSEGSHQRAVLYYLACHKVYEAIDVFANQAMYRYSIYLLARVYIHYLLTYLLTHSYLLVS